MYFDPQTLKPGYGPETRYSKHAEPSLWWFVMQYEWWPAGWSGMSWPNALLAHWRLHVLAVPFLENLLSFPQNI